MGFMQIYKLHLNFTLLGNTSGSLWKGNLKNNFLAYCRWLVFLELLKFSQATQ